jgi:predicted ferric reductase
LRPETNGNDRKALDNDQKLSSVAKTTKQFNIVVARVSTTILEESHLQTRARIIEKWIDIIQECERQQNYSSLTAIISALQVHEIHRLEATWALVHPRSITMFTKLKSIYTPCENQTKAQDILDQVS